MFTNNNNSNKEFLPFPIEVSIIVNEKNNLPAIEIRKTTTELNLMKYI